MKRLTFLLIFVLTVFTSKNATILPVQSTESLPATITETIVGGAEIVYRVIIYEGTREGAEGAKAIFETNHPGVPAYFTFQTPKFVIEVGDFKSKGKAKKLQNSIFEEYPRSIVVKRKSKLIMVGD